MGVSFRVTIQRILYYVSWGVGVILINVSLFYLLVFLRFLALYKWAPHKCTRKCSRKLTHKWAPTRKQTCVLLKFTSIFV